MRKEKKKSRKKPEHAPDYSDFVRQVSLSAISVSEGSFRLRRREFFEAIETKNFQHRLRTQYEITDASVDHFDTRSLFELAVVGSGLGPEPLVIATTIEAHFHSKVSPTPEMTERFAQSEMKVIVWPFFRQFVFDTTARMGVPPITVPLSTEMQ